MKRPMFDQIREQYERLGKQGIYLARVEWSIFLAVFISILIFSALHISMFTWQFYLLLGLAVLGLSATGYWRRRIEQKLKDRVLP